MPPRSDALQRLDALMDTLRWPAAASAAPSQGDGQPHPLIGRTIALAPGAKRQRVSPIPGADAEAVELWEVRRWRPCERQVLCARAGAGAGAALTEVDEMVAFDGLLHHTQSADDEAASSSEAGPSDAPPRGSAGGEPTRFSPPPPPSLHGGAAGGAASCSAAGASSSTASEEASSSDAAAAAMEDDVEIEVDAEDLVVDGEEEEEGVEAAPPMTAAEAHAAAAAEGLVAGARREFDGLQGRAASQPAPASRSRRRCTKAGEQQFLGSFATAEQAALAVARFLGPEGIAAALAG